MKNWKKLIADIRWAIFEHNPFGKLYLSDKKGEKLVLRPERHYRLTGKHINIRIEDKDDLDNFCRLYGCEPD